MTACVTPKAWAVEAARATPFQIGRRSENEFYPTPPEAVRALLSVETFEGPIWECACGDGAIAKVLTERGHQVVSTDLYDYSFGQSGVDFLREPVMRAKHIVTNPPYGRGLADRFVLKALELAATTEGKVAMLLDLSSLCQVERTAFWRKHVPARIHAVDGIDCWPKHKPRPAERFMTRRYCWVVWDPAHVGPTSFNWLSGAEFRD